MKRMICLVWSVVLLAGGGCAKKEPPAIKIGTIEVTAKEFDESFKMSRFFSMDPKAKAAFLEIFINRKLMLKEAEDLGLDKDPVFLQGIQLFWEQALLKLVLARKSNELAIQLRVTDAEVKEFYARNKEKHFADKDVSTVYDQIKWIILKEKERQAIQRWVDGLKKKTTITADEKQLGIEAGK